MSQSRIDRFNAMLKEHPNDEMVWYGLANELMNCGGWKEAAEALRNVIGLNPNYTAAYQLLGSALLNQGKIEEANRVWTEGIVVATHTGAWRAKQHMEALLTDIKNDAGTSVSQGNP